MINKDWLLDEIGFSHAWIDADYIMQSDPESAKLSDEEYLKQWHQEKDLCIAERQLELIVRKMKELSDRPDGLRPCSRADILNAMTGEVKE